MSWLRDKLFALGAFLCLAAAISSVGEVFGVELRYFHTLSALSPGTRWAFRGGFFALGLVLAFVLGKSATEGESVSADEYWSSYRASLSAHPGAQAFAREVERTLGASAAIAHAVALNADGMVVAPDDGSAALFVAYVRAEGELAQVSRPVKGGSLQRTTLSASAWGALVP